MRRPMVLLGTSLGGAIAVDFALAHPEAVAALVLSSPQCYTDGIGPMAALPRTLARLGVAVRAGGAPAPPRLCRPARARLAGASRATLQRAVPGAESARLSVPRWSASVSPTSPAVSRPCGHSPQMSE